jgi:hypothetical protein
MSDHKRESWLQRLCRHVRRQTSAPRDLVEGSRPVDVSVVPTAIVQPPAPGPRTTENWRDLVQSGQRVVVSWDGGPVRGAIMAQGEVRMTFDETIWIWLDRELPEDSRPSAGQAIQVLTPREDALRLIPGNLVEESRGGSLQVSVSGRVSRVQRRDDVRARVDLPPVSAVKLGPSGHPAGLLGLQAVDLSAGGIRVASTEPLRQGDRLRLVLRLDDGQPLSVTAEILIGGLAAQGRFSEMPERDRRRIVQYVYRQELAERRRIEATHEGAGF